jgi:hypothetical protein
VQHHQFEEYRMKMISLLTAAALLVAGSAYAATAAAPAAAAAPPATTSAPAPAQAALAKHDHHCRDEANEKKLAGAARASFVKKCRADSMKT